MQYQKCTMLFELATNSASPGQPTHRIGGWSESWYDENLTSQISIPFRRLCQRRAALLPTGASIVGQRYQIVNPVGTSQTDNIQFPGTAGVQADIPQMALLCKALATGARNIRTFTLRGIPDNQVTQGEYLPVAPFDKNLATFLNSLASSGWNFRGRDLSQVAHPISSISATGAVVFEEAHGLIPGDYVRILRTKLASGKFFGGRFFVNTVATTTTCGLLGWTMGDTIEGKGRKDGIVFPNIGSASPGRIVTRRVGRPFTQFRGRRSKRQ